MNMWTISTDPQPHDPEGRDGDLYCAEITDGESTRPVWIEASGSLGAPSEMVREALTTVLERGGTPPARLFLSTPPDATVDPPYTASVAY